MRHCFEDSCNMNIKVKFLSEITSFLLLKFEHANYLFPVQRFLCTFYDPAEYWF